MEKNKSETSGSLQTLVQEAREAELRVEQLRTALAKAEITVRDAWAAVGRLSFTLGCPTEPAAATSEPIPDLSADPRELLQTKNLAQLCFQILEASPTPVTIRDIHQIVLDAYPDRAAGYSVGHLQSSLAKALKRKPLVFKQIASGGPWTLLAKFKP